MKQISWENCGQCPFVQHFTGGTKLACGHGDVVWKKPYSNDRFVEMHTVADFCPVADADPLVPIIFLKDVIGNGFLYAQRDSSGVIVQNFPAEGFAMVKTDNGETTFYAKPNEDFTVVCGLASMERTS